jgi:hypothetical protein
VDDGRAQLVQADGVAKRLAEKTGAIRVARFFLTQYTKTVKNIPNYHTITKMTIKYTKGP